MMGALIQRLLAEKPVLTDGAWGTELQKQGLAAGRPADIWNLEHPDRVEGLARAYVEAGSRIILTNTFQANRITLARHGLAGQVAAINRTGVEISRRAGGEHVYVFAAMGPSGKLLMSGEVTETELREAFTEQAQVLATAGADAIVVETMSDLEEARLAVSAAQATGLPVVACMAFDSGKNRDRTMMGTTLQQAATELTAAGAEVIGANCGQGVERFLELYRGLASATDRPIWLQPNAGSPELVESRTVYRKPATEFARDASVLCEEGAAFIGGCCGTTPSFIRALAEVLHRGRQHHPLTPCSCKEGS
jgi:5-methyltetrahydrofolate--homocysteine methyltransferase